MGCSARIHLADTGDKAGFEGFEGFESLKIKRPCFYHTKLQPSHCKMTIGVLVFQIEQHRVTGGAFHSAPSEKNLRQQLLGASAPDSTRTKRILYTRSPRWLNTRVVLN